MSRIAGVLKRAEAERARSEAENSGAAGPPAGGRPHGGAPASEEAVPWAIEDGARTGRPSRDRNLVRGGRALADLPVPRGGRFGRGTPPPSDPPALHRYWDVVRRRWVTGLLVLLVVVGGVTAGVLLEEPVYRASGLLEIRRESTGAVPVDSLFSSEKMPSDDLETQYGILKSDTLAERVVAQAGKANADKLGDFRDDLIVNPLRGSRLVEIAYVNEDPRLAALAVNSVLDTYLQLRMEEAQRTARWLEQQLHDAQRRLEDSERRLQAYIQVHGLQVVETGKGEAAELANQRLQALHEALAQAQAERMGRESADEATRRAGAAQTADSPVVQNLTVRLADLRREHAKLASAFHEEYPAVKALNDQIGELERALADESRSVVARGQRDYQAALRKEALLRKALDEQNALVQDLAQESAGSAGYEALRRELVTNQEQFGVLSQKLREMSISAALKAQNVGVVDRATPPSIPYGTPLPLTLALTLGVGLVVAVGGVFLREHLDTSVRTVAEVETYLGVPTLGAIPAVAIDPVALPAWASPAPRRWGRIGAGEGPRSPLAEAFATLRNAVLLHDGAASSRVLLVTSAQSEEGKTTISVNLALSLARLEYRVLLVDANMRFPCVRYALGLADGPSLADYLSSHVGWREAVQAGVQPNLDVLAGAEPQASPADLLSRPSMADLLDEAAAEYDFVILDSPAVLTHPADVRSLAAVADNVLFTVRHGWTPREVVALALSQLDRVSGVVLNRSKSPDFRAERQEAPKKLPAAGAA
ncbi:MAG: capsular exopolysaccharide family [Acidobacteria bacterium]|nr:capsular exopolysaccharide family [Acidobacteriota bacterium]